MKLKAECPGCGRSGEVDVPNEVVEREAGVTPKELDDALAEFKEKGIIKDGIAQIPCYECLAPIRPVINLMKAEMKARRRTP